MKTKRFLLLCLLIGISAIQLPAQTLKKGVVVSVNTYTINLNPDVTMNQFLDFFMNKYIPEYEKNFPGVREFVASADRGQNKNQIGTITYYESIAVRNKYYPSEGEEMSDIAKAALEKMKALNEEFNKYVVEVRRDYTDWVIK